MASRDQRMRAVKSAAFALFAVFLVACSDQRTLADPHAFPDLIRAGYEIRDENDLKTLATIYGPPAVIDFRRKFVMYAAEYLVYHDPLEQLLTWNFDPYMLETWFLFIATDGTYANRVYRHVNSDADHPTRSDGPFPHYTETDADRICDSSAAVSSTRIDGYRATLTNHFGK